MLKFVPLLLLLLLVVAVGGLFFFDADNLGPFNASGGSAVGAGEVEDPRRTVGRATVIGTAAAALVLRGRRDRVDRGRPVRDAVTASPAAAFALWLVAGAGYMAVHQGVLFLSAGVLVYAVPAGRRARERRSASGAPPLAVDRPGM